MRSPVSEKNSSVALKVWAHRCCRARSGRMRAAISSGLVSLFAEGQDESVTGPSDLKLARARASGRRAVKALQGIIRIRLARLGI